MLPRCQGCNTLIYPVREICAQCLCDDSLWGIFDPQGAVIACVAVHRSYREAFQTDTPWYIASVALREGPVVYAHAAGWLSPGASASLIALTDRDGDGVFGVITEVPQCAVLESKFSSRAAP